MTPTRAGKALRARAFAKVNLTLRVLGVRADGYHELRTTFQSLALHDTLVFTPAKGFALECDDPACPSDQRNLVWRAAEEIWRGAKKKGEPSGVHVRIVKRIPMQAGLGGGSSDAAAALRAFATLWKASAPAVQDAARRLGADVPFFLEGGTALGVERGDVLFPLADWPAAWVVLALPAFGVSTKDAYAWFDASKTAASEKGSGGFSREKTSRPLFQTFPEMWNDLQRPVVERHAEIERLVAVLERAGADYAAMSGSGSAVFGLFPSRASADRAARRLGAQKCQAIVTKTLSRRSFRARSSPA